MPTPHEEIIFGLTLTVEWTQTVAEDVWQQLLDAGARRKDGQRSRVNLGPVFTDSPVPSLFTLHGTHDDDSEPGWRLQRTPAPGPVPPPQVQELSAKVGGWPGLRTLLNMVRSDGDVPHVISFVVPEPEWRCRMIPRTPSPTGSDTAALAISPKALIEQVGYRFPDRPDGLDQVAVIYYHEPQVYVVTCGSRVKLEVGDEPVFPYANRTAVRVLSAFFDNRGGGNG